VSDTPRTDAEWQEHDRLDPVCAANFAALCKQLERELAQSKEANAGLMNACKHLESEMEKLQNKIKQL
jgi:poly(3-hydroxyalkanoate) synthetase